MPTRTQTYLDRVDRHLTHVPAPSPAAAASPLPILLKARELIEARGWTKLAFGDNCGRISLDFAIIKARKALADDWWGEVAAARCLREAIAARGTDPRFALLCDWNGHVAKDKADVLALLDAALAKAGHVAEKVAA